MQKTTILKSLGVTNPDSFLLIAGPCVVESRDMTLRIAEQLAQASSKLQLPLVFKASYRKANRSSLDSFTGIGDDKALQILEEVKRDNPEEKLKDFWLRTDELIAVLRHQHRLRKLHRDARAAPCGCHGRRAEENPCMRARSGLRLCCTATI